MVLALVARKEIYGRYVALGNIHDMDEIANCRTIRCVMVHSIDIDCFAVAASREGNWKEIGRWQSWIFSNRA
jgi:hypothetical protein